MKILLKLLWSVLLLLIINTAKAQDARALIKEGVDLSNAKNYAGAIEKYKAALVLEPDNTTANYRLAFSLNASGKGTNAIPYLQKAITPDASAALQAASYSLLGSIYDRSSQPKKAIESYLAGIKADSADQSLRYNLGLVYFRERQYSEAEQCAIASLKADPKHAGSMRLYALVTFHQDNRAAALLGLCQFLWMEPNGPKSDEAYGNLQSILKGGALKAEPGTKAPAPVDANKRELNQAITSAIAEKNKKTIINPADKLATQLKAVFTKIGPLADKQKSSDPFLYSLTSRYFNLAQTENMAAFARVISQANDKTVAVWIKAHPKQVTDLDEWQKAQTATQ